MNHKPVARTTAALQPVSLYVSLVVISMLTFLYRAVPAQESRVLSLPDAVETGVTNYQRIRAKQHYLDATTAASKSVRNEYLPNVIASIQQNYGTINGQFGPQAAVGVLGVASAGPVYNEQNWNAAFGALYIINANWEVFSFGRVKSRIQQADAQVRVDSADLAQERFVHQVKISGAYLGLLVARELVSNAQANLRRAETLQQNVLARTRTGLNAGVDSSLANAEVSRARLALISTRDQAQQAGNQLTRLLNIAPADLVLDTMFLRQPPTAFETAAALAQNPQIRFYQARADLAEHTLRMTRKSLMPGLTLFGIYQARASGFEYNYSPENPARYSSSYLDGIEPSRYNYVAGVSLFWNLTSPLKVKEQVHAQQFVAEARHEEHDQITTELQHELVRADERIENNMQKLREVPQQYRAASDAYNQHNVLYKNGLATIADLQQALYTLNRAEVDLRMACVNVWQALLLKAAATGDFGLFMDQTFNNR